MANKLLDIRLLEEHYTDNMLNHSDDVNKLLREDSSTAMYIYGDSSYIILHNFLKREIEVVVGVGVLDYMKSNKVIWLEIVAREESTQELVYEVKELFKECIGRYAVIVLMPKVLEQYLPEVKRNYFSSFRLDSKSYYFLEDENIIQYNNTSEYYRYWLDVSSASVRNLMTFMDCFSTQGEIFQQEVKNYLLSIFNFDSNIDLLELRDHQTDSVIIRSILHEDRRDSRLLTVLVAFDEVGADSSVISRHEKYEIFSKFYILYLMDFMGSTGKKYRKLKVILKLFEDHPPDKIEDFKDKVTGMDYIGDGFFSFVVSNDCTEGNMKVESF